MSGYAWPARRAAAADAGRAAREVALGAAAAAAAGLLVGVDPFYALLVPGALAAVWFALRPIPAAVALGVSIPFVQTVASGHLGLNIGVSDLLLVLLVFAAAGSAVLARDAAAFRLLRPVRLPALQYCVFVLVLLFAHLGSGTLAQTLQRYELIAFPLVVGSYLALRGAHVALLQAYVGAATLLALVFPFDSLGLQKNPAGQFIVGAILLLVGLPRLGRLRFVLPLLVYGLFVTESRGSLLACAVGVAVLLGFRWVSSPRQAIATGLAIVAIAGLGFELMPSQGAGIHHHVSGAGGEPRSVERPLPADVLARRALDHPRPSLARGGRRLVCERRSEPPAPSGSVRHLRPA